MLLEREPDRKRRFKIVGICHDGERLVFGEGLDIVQAYERFRKLRAQSSLPRLVVEIERSERESPA